MKSRISPTDHRLRSGNGPQGRRQNVERSPATESIIPTYIHITPISTASTHICSHAQSRATVSVCHLSPLTVRSSWSSDAARMSWLRHTYSSSMVEAHHIEHRRARVLQHSMRTHRICRHRMCRRRLCRHCMRTACVGIVRALCVQAAYVQALYVQIVSRPQTT